MEKQLSFLAKQLSFYCLSYTEYYITYNEYKNNFYYISLYNLQYIQKTTKNYYYSIGGPERPPPFIGPAL
jgi:hypothetical protein